LILGVAVVGVVAIGLGILWYFSPSDQSGSAARKVQTYYIRGGVERARGLDCSSATDDERSLDLYACKISSRDPIVFDMIPPPPRNRDTAYLCFFVESDRDSRNRLQPSVTFFGVAKEDDHDVCIRPDRMSRPVKNGPPSRRLKSDPLWWAATGRRPVAGAAVRASLTVGGWRLAGAGGSGC